MRTLATLAIYSVFLSLSHEYRLFYTFVWVFPVHLSHFNLIIRLCKEPRRVEENVSVRQTAVVGFCAEMSRGLMEWELRCYEGACLCSWIYVFSWRRPLDSWEWEGEEKYKAFRMNQTKLRWLYAFFPICMSSLKEEGSPSSVSSGVQTLGWGKDRNLNQQGLEKGRQYPLDTGY